MDSILGKIGIFLLCLLLIPAFVGLGGGMLIGTGTHSVILEILWFAFCAFICGVVAKKMDDDEYGAIKWSILLSFAVFAYFIIELIFNITNSRTVLLNLLSGSGDYTPAQIANMWHI